MGYEMTEEKVDIAIIGAGVIGLAVAAEISAQQPGRSIVVIEKNEKFGQVTSSRNSEVIHAGIYYPTGSLKACLCVHGKELLYRFCEKWGVPHKRCGKLIVANTPEEEESLAGLMEQAAANGVEDLELLGKDQVKRLEPNIRANKAIFSPSTGIINSHHLMDRLEQLALENGVMPAYCHLVKTVEPLPAKGSGYRVHFNNPDGTNDTIDCCHLINCAGLQSDQIASLAGIDPGTAGYKLQYYKGEYFSLPPSKANRISRLIYPPPLQSLTGLGIHATVTLDGRLRLGPNTVYIDREDYSVDPAHGQDFYRSARAYLPFIEEEDLEPEMAGIRPKLSGPGESFRDFIVREESERGLPGLINLVGIESPGLTCALSIARMVADLIS
ncbi:MAG: NAD(P)/FAD-dependent oxidoreductase [Bacillota bacterium]